MPGILKYCNKLTQLNGGVLIPFSLFLSLTHFHVSLQLQISYPMQHEKKCGAMRGVF